MGKVKTRIERNKEIITEVYRWIEEEEEKLDILTADTVTAESIDTAISEGVNEV